MSTTDLVKPFIVVDSDVQESASNYASIIDSVNKNTEFSAKLNELSSELNDALYKEVLDSVILLKSLPDKELEPTLNLVFYLIAEPLFVNGDDDVAAAQQKFTERFSSLLNTLYEISPVQNPAFNDRQSIKFTTILSILTVFFNLIDQQSSLRYQILATILKSFSKLDKQSLEENAYLLKPLLKKSTVDGQKFIFEKYLADAKASAADIIAFTSELSNLVELNYPNEALIVLKSVLLKYNTENNSEAINILAIKALRNNKEIDLSYLYKFNLSGLKAKHSILHELLSLYTLSKNNLQQFNEFALANKAVIEKELDIVVSALITKKEFLVVANLALRAAESSDYESVVEENDEAKNSTKTTTNIGPVITYKQISDELGHNNDLVKIESVLINAVKLNIFQGKIDQLKQIFAIYKINLVIVLDDEKSNSTDANDNKLGNKEWKFILNNLRNWKKSLSEVTDIIEQQKKKLHHN